MRRINYKSDIPPLLLSLKVDENQITVPDCDFIVRFYIDGYEGRHYDCSHIGGVWSNCEPSEDGTKLVCYINNQRLGIGELCAEFHYISPNSRYSDGSQKSVVIIDSTELGVELVEDNGDAVTEAAIDVTLPFIYRTAYEIARDHGYTGTAEDFYSALASVVGIADAEKKRVTAEITRNANEQERIENEENRLNAESERVNAEAQRVRNEAIRGEGENTRIKQEDDRKAKFEEITGFIATVRANEGNRESNELERQANENTRITEEAKRVEAEKKRAAEFEKQKLDLSGKIDRSGDEMGGDLIFTDNAGVSFRTSDGGVHTMFNDTDDVAKFTADNGDTFEFKHNETPNKNSSAVVVSKNLYNALDMTLDSMGRALDGDAMYRAEDGDKIFNPDTSNIQRYNSTVGGFEDLCDPIDGKLYVNKLTGYIYRWNTEAKKMVFVGGVKAYTKDEADGRFAKLDDVTQRVKVKELDAGNFVSAKSMWIGDEGLLLGGDGNGHLTVEQDEVITDVTLNEKLATKVDKTDITQSTGTSTTSVMSQKAVSDAIDIVADSINKLKNAGYLYAGIATPTTNPGTPDGPVFYIALQAGTYSNFGNTEIDNTGIFTWDGSSWSSEKLGFIVDIPIVNDLITGGEGNALSAEMGKVLAESCGVKKDVFTQTLCYNIFPAKGDYPIMIAGKTYSIHIQGDKPMGQTQWELWGRTESGTALIRKFGSTDISVEQVITYTPAADIYAIGCNYFIDVQDTTVMITYKIDYGTYHSEHERRLEALDEVLQYGTALIIDVSGIQKISDNAPYWVYKQRIPIMFAGGTYKITVTAGAVIPSYQKWELWCSDYDLTSSTRVKLFEITGVDMSIGASFVVKATQDIYSLYCGYQNADLGSTITMAYKVEQDKESQRLHDIEDDVRACEDAISSAGINRFDSYYRLGATENDTINLITRPIGLIVMGQSNADGRIPNSSFPSTATIDTTDDLTLSNQIAHCLFMKGDQESTYSEPSKNFAARNNSGNWAFDDIVYNAVNHALGGNTDFYVIKQTRGATGIRLANGSFNANVNEFVKNGYDISQLYHFKLLIERALELNPYIDFKAILWHQGEAEWEVTEEGLYYECLCQIIYWLRGKVGNPKLPFIFGTVPTDSEQYSAVVKADMEKVAQDINDCYLIDIGAAGDMIDQYHFGASTAERLAREMYKIMRQNYMLAPMINPL